MINYLASADFAVYSLQKDCLNSYLTLANKVGEYIMAGLPIAVSDFPEMRKLAVDMDLGVVFDPEDPHDIARAIRELLDPKVYARKKENVLKMRKVLCWENEEKKLLDLYSKLEQGVEGRKRMFKR